MGRLRSVLWLATSVVSTACLTDALVTNLDNAACRGRVTTAITRILVGQREPPGVAEPLAEEAVLAMGPGKVSHGSFTVSSPSGTDYVFVFRLDDRTCLLRLYGRGKGRWMYTNDLTYIATEPLRGCACVAGVSLVGRRGVGMHTR